MGAIKVMGIDASTATVGLSVLSKNRKIKLVHYDFFKPPKISQMESLSKTKSFIMKKILKFEPDEMVIEEIVKYMKGGSGAKTVIPLAVMNRTIALTYYELTGKQPHFLSVLKVRHAIKFDIKLPPKEKIPEIVAKHLNIKFPYVKNKKKIKQESYDVADSIAVALAYLKVK